MNDTKIECPCKRLKCERHGDCKACIEYHKTSKRKRPTACEKLELKNEKRRKGISATNEN